MNARQWRRILLISLFGIGQCVFLFAYVFVVRFVKVEGNVYVPSASIVEATSLQVGEYYWSYLLQGLPQRVRQLPALESANLRLCPGGVVLITVQERPAVAQVATGNADSPWAAVAANGAVLGPITGSNSVLPKVYAYHVIPLTGQVPQEVIDSLSLVHPSCKSMFGADLDSYSFDASMRVIVHIKLMGYHTNILLGEAQTIGEKTQLLRALVDSLRQKGAPVKQIDLRFRNAVVAMVAPPSPSPSPSPTPSSTSEPTEAVEATETSEDEANLENVEIEYYQEGEPDIGAGDAGYAEDTSAAAPVESGYGDAADSSNAAEAPSESAAPADSGASDEGGAPAATDNGGYSEDVPTDVAPTANVGAY